MQYSISWPCLSDERDLVFVCKIVSVVYTFFRSMACKERVSVAQEVQPTSFTLLLEVIDAAMQEQLKYLAGTYVSTLFENPFQMQDLQVFDDFTLCMMLTRNEFGLTIASLAHALHNIQEGSLLKRIESVLSVQQRARFLHALHAPLSQNEVEQAQRQILDGLFWELTYWKTPELYEELTEGECLHPGIFVRLQPDLQGKIALDAGAGSGRASLECIRSGAKLVYAINPRPAYCIFWSKNWAIACVITRSFLVQVASMLFL